MIWPKFRKKAETPDPVHQFERFIAVARQNDVESFSIGETAVRFHESMFEPAITPPTTQQTGPLQSKSETDLIDEDDPEVIFGSSG